MSTIILDQNLSSVSTTISNIFIDRYMPAANGSYVKVYLYLLRCIMDPDTPLSISFLADRLDDTEKDILRALNYWEKHQVIALQKNADGSIAHITLLNLSEAGNLPQEQSAAASVLSAANETAAVNEPDKPVYTPDQINRLTGNDEMKWLLNIIEIYLERLLKPVDVQLVLYLHEELHFSTELIMHLYDYCVSKNKKNPAYIEAVALSWAAEGIDSVEKAEHSAEQYSENYNAVKKAFGLNRTPGNIEMQYIEKWSSSLGFTAEIMTEACDRALLHTGKPDFKYADRILEVWKKKNVKLPADIALLDSEHSQRVSAAKKPPSSIPHTKTPVSNRFSSFPQRNYSASDYTTIEQKLLQKERPASK